MYLFSNDWVKWFWDTYTVTIVAVPSIIIGILKIIAILVPSAKTDKIRELFELWSKKEN